MSGEWVCHSKAEDHRLSPATCGCVREAMLQAFSGDNRDNPSPYPSVQRSLSSDYEVIAAEQTVTTGYQTMRREYSAPTANDPLTRDVLVLPPSALRRRTALTNNSGHKQIHVWPYDLESAKLVNSTRLRSIESLKDVINSIGYETFTVLMVLMTVCGQSCVRPYRGPPCTRTFVTRSKYRWRLALSPWRVV
ncbi:uncharacterized protein LY79DRAFT_576601 [Colletotrichum navitas]|uniref:Uncharacterized protein n=1 Tax=Colletotrichum navitas TaxID=681940 RepID=A0AAD8Q7H8_9PEZI|nr:uncharacterized protein LY79DRAFT_576601 [Colletotrichum navitas]KAK1597285.1 hypothetical protein LY79DRAFT_576601 [Colletotrichum navitas]